MSLLFPPRTASICLRCEARLLRSLAAPTRGPSSRTFSHSSPFPSSSYPNRTNHHRTSSGETVWKSLKQGGRIRGKRAHRYVESSSPISKPSLGRPTEVIVLRDQDSQYTTEEIPPPQPSDVVPEDDGKKMEARDLLASMTVDRGVLSKDDVARNIEKLRGDMEGPGRILGRTRWTQLADELFHGFTRLQLQDYLKRSPSVNKEVRGHERPKPAGGRRVELDQTDWQPGITSFGTPLPRIRKLKTVFERGSKMALVEQVIMGCWGLQSQTEVDSIGEVEVSLPPQQLSLLLMESRALLKTLSERRNAKLDVSRSRSILRITADKTRAEEVIKDLQYIVGNIREVAVELAPLRGLFKKAGDFDDAFDASALESIAGTTGTEIEVRETEDTLVIHYLGPDTTEADDARRLLMSLTPDAAHVTSTVLCEQISPEDQHALYRVSGSMGLSWTTQEKKWSRYRCSASRDTGFVPSTFDNDPQGIQDSIQNFFSSTANTSTAPRSSQTWTPQEKDLISATYGTLLHAHPNPHCITPSPNLSALIDSASPRTFSSSTPGLFETLRTLSPGPSAENEESIIIHLQPSPWNTTKKSSRPAPPIEITLSLDPSTKTPSLKAVTALLHDHVLDLMTPSSTTDIRFSHPSLLRMTSPESHTHLNQFLRDSRLKINTPGRLRTPTSLYLSLPRWTLVEDTLGLGMGMENEETMKAEEVEIQYLFTGLEYRQTLGFLFEGWRTTFTAVEAGRTGGRRGVLRVWMESDGIEQDGVVRDGKLGDGESEEASGDEFERFYDATRRLGRTMDDVLRPVSGGGE
ncbi:MAG: hypothetical protein M1817_004862 [Caeruleum heppii]|nr:MAG: hypothetical protein M1817_004862 [Caeruleum heppii]